MRGFSHALQVWSPWVQIYSTSAPPGVRTIEADVGWVQHITTFSNQSGGLGDGHGQKLRGTSAQDQEQ